MIPKFRAWDKKTETIQEVESISFKEKKLVIDQKSVAWFNSDYIRNFDEVELMQSTGLKDKNGVDVYQGDIIRCTSGCLHEVIWLEEYGGTFIGGMPAWYLSGFRNGYSWTGREEVIGNIYENSELLGTMPKIFAIKADSDDQGWMDSFNGWNDSNYSLNQKIDEKEVEVLESKIDKFNHEVACGPAIRLEEQQ